MSKYAIINIETIQQRIEELEENIKFLDNNEPSDYPETKNKVLIQNKKELVILKQILSQSTPLIPEIEKAFDEGQNRMQHEIIERLGLRYQIEQVSQTTILNMEVHSEDYISNLKLDI